MSLLLGREAQDKSRPQGHPVDHACWWCAPEDLLNQAARGEQLERPLHLNVDWWNCPVARTPLRCPLCGARQNDGQRAGEPCPAGGCGGRLAERAS